MWVDTSIGVPIGAEVRISESGQIQLIDDEGKVISPNRPLLIQYVRCVIKLNILYYNVNLRSTRSRNRTAP